MTGHDMSIRIGELLEKAGLVNAGDLAEAVAVSKRANMPIGRVLVAQLKENQFLVAGYF